MQALLEQLLPILIPILTSAVMWLSRQVVPWIKSRPNPLQAILLAVLGVGVAYVASLVGTTVGADPSTWNEVTASGLVGAIVAHFIYRTGKSSVKR